MRERAVELKTPLTTDEIRALRVGDIINISGKIYCGRDAVLPKICDLYEKDRLFEHGIELNGSVIFHSAVSKAGVGPTSSNKVEIEQSMRTLSRAGIRIHMGKGAISKETVEALDQYGSIFVLVPPVTALLNEKMTNCRAVAFPELGMEAFYELEVCEYPAIIGVAKGDTIFTSGGQ